MRPSALRSPRVRGPCAWQLRVRHGGRAAPLDRFKMPNIRLDQRQCLLGPSARGQRYPERQRHHAVGHVGPPPARRPAMAAPGPKERCPDQPMDKEELLVRRRRSRRAMRGITGVGQRLMRGSSGTRLRPSRTRASAWPGFHRHREQVPLPELAAHRDQQISLYLGFDSLGNHLQVKCPSDLDDAFHQGQPLLRGGDPVDERLVYLEHVYRQFPQVTKRRVPSTEIVDS